MIVWLLRKGSGWNRFLVQRDSRSAAVGRGLLHTLKWQLDTHTDYSSAQVSALTLICRRLLWFCSSGFEITDRISLIRDLDYRGAWRLPRADTFSGDVSESKQNWYQRCEEQTARSFLDKVWPFLTGDNAFNKSSSTNAADLAGDRELDGYLHDRGDAYGYSVESTGRGHPLLGIFSAQAAATSILAPDPRPVAAVHHLLNRHGLDLRRYDYEDRMLNRKARVLGGLVSVFSGVRIRDVVDISLAAPRDLSQVHRRALSSCEGGRILGWISSDSELAEMGICEGAAQDKRYFLILTIGPCRSPHMQSRITNQHIFAPLPPLLNRLIENCQDEESCERGNPRTFGEAIVSKSVERIRSAIVSTFTRNARLDRNIWIGQTVESYLRRPDRMFRYFASVRCRIPPARLNLLFGEPFGPWRAVSNYACVGRERLAKDFELVQRAMLIHAEWELDDWKRTRIVGVAGAGLLSAGRIGDAGIPSIAALAKEIRPVGHDLACSASALDSVVRLFGRRFSTHLRGPDEEFVPALKSYCFIDKNIGGRLYPRLVPVPRGVLNILKPDAWLPVPNTIPVPRGLEEKIRSSRILRDDRNAGRKALFSELLRRGVADEAISTIFGHGLSLTKLLGPISPFPSRWYLEQLRRVLSDLSVEDAVPVETMSISPPNRIQIRQARRFKKSSGRNLEDSDIIGFAVEGDVKHLPMPEREAQSFFEALKRRILDGWETHHRSEINLRRCLFLLACLSGLPMKRTWHMRRYLRIDSFVERLGESGETDYFVMMVVPQKDRGLGIIPIPIEREVGKACRGIVLELAKSSEGKFPRGRVLIAGDVQKIGQLLRFAESLVYPNFRSRRGTRWVTTALEKASQFHSRISFGAMIFGALDGRAILPPNYFAVEDLFFQANGSHRELRTFEGLPWEDKFGVPQRQSVRIRSMRRACRPGGRGRPSSQRGFVHPPLTDFPALALHIAGVISAVDAVGCAKWFEVEAIYFSKFKPATSKRKDLESAYWRSGAEVARWLLYKGRCTTGSPEHLLWPEQTERFLEIVAGRIAESKGTVARHRQASEWWVRTILFLGCRPNEASNIGDQHIDNKGAPDIVRVLGTKTESGQRTIDLALFFSDSVGWALYLSLVEPAGWRTARDAKFPRARRDRSNLQRALNRVLHGAYRQLREELGLPPPTGSFSLNSLRHAAAFRVVQNSIQKYLWRGSIWIQLASVSTALGHQSLVTTWASYLGTSMVSLRWPSHKKGDADFCLLRDLGFGDPPRVDPVSEAAKMPS